jgi:hypothetical protein
MQMTDVDTNPKISDLKSAIPPNIAKKMGNDGVNAIISKNVVHTNQPDYSSMMAIDSLPSKYLRYPEGTKIYGRPFNIKELIKLANINDQNALTIIDDMIRSTIKGIAIDDILVGDKIYLLLWLRANTYPESGYSIPFRCQKCEAESTYDFKVDAIDIDYMRSDFNIEDPVELSTGDFIAFKYLTMCDEQRIQKFKSSVRTSMTKYDDDILSLAAAVETINGEKKSLIEVYNFISNVKIYSQIKGYLEAFNFGVSNVLNVVCNKCGGVGPVGITFQSDFFLPSYQFKHLARNDV